MEVIGSEQVWKETPNADLIFDHTRLIIRQGPHYLFARQKDRYTPIDATNLNQEEISDAFLFAQIPAD